MKNSFDSSQNSSFSDSVSLNKYLLYFFLKISRLLLWWQLNQKIQKRGNVGLMVTSYVEFTNPNSLFLAMGSSGRFITVQFNCFVLVSRFKGRWCCSVVHDGHSVLRGGPAQWVDEGLEGITKVTRYFVMGLCGLVLKRAGVCMCVCVCCLCARTHTNLREVSFKAALVERTFGAVCGSCRRLLLNSQLYGLTFYKWTSLSSRILIYDMWLMTVLIP